MTYVQVAIGIVLRRDGMVLVTRRAQQDRFAGLWEFPGGKILPAESDSECLHRELQEELDISVRVLARLAPIAHDYGDLKVCLHPFVAALELGDPKPLAARELKWVTPSELATLAFPEANAPLIAQLEYILRTMPLMDPPA